MGWYSWGVHLLCVLLCVFDVVVVACSCFGCESCCYAVYLLELCGSVFVFSFECGVSAVCDDGALLA